MSIRRRLVSVGKVLTVELLDEAEDVFIVFRFDHHLRQFTRRVKNGYTALKKAAASSIIYVRILAPSHRLHKTNHHLDGDLLFGSLAVYVARTKDGAIK